MPSLILHFPFISCVTDTEFRMASTSLLPMATRLRGDMTVGGPAPWATGLECSSEGALRRWALPTAARADLLVCRSDHRPSLASPAAPFGSLTDSPVPLGAVASQPGAGAYRAASASPRIRRPALLRSLWGPSVSSDTFLLAELPLTEEPNFSILGLCIFS